MLNSEVIYIYVLFKAHQIMNIYQLTKHVTYILMYKQYGKLLL